MTRGVVGLLALITGFGTACSSEDGDGDGSGGNAGGANAGRENGGSSGKASGGQAGTMAGRSGSSGSGGSNAGSSGSSSKGGSGGTAGSGQGTAGSDSGGEGGDGGTATAGTSGTGGSAGNAGSAGGTGAPGVRIVGRTTPGPMSGERLSWVGTNIHARFRGTQISLQLADGDNHNEYAIVIDGNVTNLATTDGDVSYELASDLDDTTHDLVIWRRSESYYNPSEFLGFDGFSEGGGLLAPPPAPDRRIEIIGDSITVGYGNEETQPCTASQSNGNNYLAYGSVAARMLDADLVTIAWSGIGMYRNFDAEGPSEDAMPARYDTIIPTDSSAPDWDFSKYVPHAVVINLGTNDYSTHGDPGQPYVDAYVGFLDRVRENYPDAYIFCLSPFSEATPNISAAVDELKAGGDDDLEVFEIEVTEGADDGCDWHPNLERHAAMGERLATRMASVMGWD